MTERPLPRITLALALAWGLACGGGGGGDEVVGSASAPTSAAPGAPAVAAPASTPKELVLADSSWDVTWPGREAEGTDHVTFHADGTVTDMGGSDVKGSWKATGRTFHYDWNQAVTYDGEVAADGSKITGTWVMGEQNGTWLAVPPSKASPAAAGSPPANSTGSGSGLPSCSDLWSACLDQAESVYSSCIASCEGDEGCDSACRDGNSAARSACYEPSNCR